jgi:hypothetical protein
MGFAINGNHLLVRVGVLYELYQAGHNFSKLHAQMCRFFKLQHPLYLNVTIIQVHHHARVMFERYCKDGYPMLDHRNRWCGFEQRQAAHTEVVWQIAHACLES